jgi:hypothetical protein
MLELKLQEPALPKLILLEQLVLAMAQLVLLEPMTLRLALAERILLRQKQLFDSAAKHWTVIVRGFETRIAAPRHPPEI